MRFTLIIYWDGKGFWMEMVKGMVWSSSVNDFWRRWNSECTMASDLQSVTRSQIGSARPYTLSSHWKSEMTAWAGVRLGKGWAHVVLRCVVCFLILSHQAICRSSLNSRAFIAVVALGKTCQPNPEYLAWRKNSRAQRKQRPLNSHLPTFSCPLACCRCAWKGPFWSGNSSRLLRALASAGDHQMWTTEDSAGSVGKTCEWGSTN